MIRHHARIVSLWALAAAITFLLAFAIVAQVLPKPYREFVFTVDGQTYRGLGNEIRSSGFCTELVKDAVVTSVVCGAHMVIEIYRQPGPGRLPAGPSGKTVASN